MFRQLARDTREFDLSWPAGLSVSSVAERDAEAIGAFLLRVGHELHPDCESGTLAGATFYVTRLFDYHRRDANFEFALESSTVVRDESNGGVVAVCMIGGGGKDGQEFGIYDILVAPPLRCRGIGTNMIRRALSILHHRGIDRFHLWRNDGSPAARLYDRLGFVATGEAEGEA